MEGAVVLALSGWLFSRIHGTWSWWALFLVPDLAFIGFAFGRRAGTVAYNAVHTYAGPIGLAAVGLAAEQPAALELGLVWGGHIGADRFFGYGLRYAADMKDSTIRRA